MLDPSDPRASLASYGGGAKRPAAQSAPAQYLSLHEMPAAEPSEAEKTWWVRGQNFVLAYTEAQAGAQLVRENQPDEYVALNYDRSCSIEILANTERRMVAGGTLTILPPGASQISIREPGRIVRVFSGQSRDLLEKSSNREAYKTPHPNVLPWSSAPPPLGGFGIRTFSLDVAERPDRFGRIFRTSNLMVNFVTSRDGPRDTSKLSPHSHDDFEQGSLLIEGECVQHVRYPWLSDLATWMPDEHVRVDAPSMTIFPPPCIHTSMWISAGRNQLIDIFCPPRLDWAQQPGWVLNADEYPAAT